MGAKLRTCQKCGREYTRSAENGGGFKYCCLDCAYAARKDKYNAFYAPEREAAAERRREREEQRAAGTYITRPYERHKAKQTDNDAEIKRINAEAQAAGMLGGEDHVFHAGILGRCCPAFGVEMLGFESLV